MSSSELYSSYTQMRHSGLAAQEVLKTLRSAIDQLPSAQREELTLRLRQWERDFVAPAAPPEEASPAAPQASVEGASGSGTWIACPDCGRKNRRQEIFCYGCGAMLEPPASRHLETRQFADATAQLFTDDFFGEDSILVFTVRDTDERFEVRPQTRPHELVMGRSAHGATMSPDIDLGRAEAVELGVSRLHLAVRYDRAANAIEVHDLGSANGTYVNGQRLLPREQRILRNGDELRLGRLVLRVSYLHPGAAV